MPLIRSRWFAARCLVFVAILHPLTTAAEPGATITVHAGQPLFRLSDVMVGANIEDLHYQLTGGLSSQLIHGESFFEPSPTQIALSREAVRGFTSWLGAWTPVDDGELGAVVTGEKGKIGARITSNRTAAADVVETAVDLRSTEPAGLLVGVGAVDGDDKWEWYTGYTVELQPKEGVVILSKATRPSSHRELKRTAVPATTGEWSGLALHQEGKLLEVKIDGKVVMEYEDDEPLKPARVGVFSKGETRFKGFKLKTRTGGWWDIPFRESDLIARPGDAISLRWEKVQNGTAAGSFALDPAGGWHPGKPSQTVTFLDGEGEVGIDNAGLKRWGISLTARKPYEGFIRVKTAAATDVYVSLRSADGSRIYAMKLLKTQANPDEYQRIEFTLTPDQADADSRFAITMTKPGSMTMGYAFLQPGEWARYKGLPIRKDLAEAIIAQGIGVLRLNGGMIERPDYRWKNMQGPRDQRPPYDGFYDRWCSNGFGAIEFLQFCEAAKIAAITGLNVDESPQEVADFIEYVNGSTATPAGKRRAADGHPAPYRLQYYQVGNETPITPAYVEKFKAIAEAVWKIDPEITLIPSGKVYRFKASDVDEQIAKRLAPHVEITRFAHERGRKLLWDCHAFLTEEDSTEAIAPDGPIAGAAELSRRLEKLAPECGVIPVATLEINAGRIDFLRGLKHALEMNIVQRNGDRIRAAAMPNVSQPWGVSQTDWKAVLRTQGNIYYTQDKVWFQPAYYVDQMISRDWLPMLVKVDVAASPKTLDVTARTSDDGKHLVLQVVNLSKDPVSTEIWLNGFAPKNSTAKVEDLSSGDLAAFNTLEEPEKIKPTVAKWEHQLKGGRTSRTFPGQSFTVIRLE